MIDNKQSINERLSARESAMQSTFVQAKNDFNSGLEADPGRHGARKGSQWETWYLLMYNELTEDLSGEIS